MKKIFLGLILMGIGGAANASTVLLDFEEFAYQENYGALGVTTQGYDVSTSLGAICGGPGDTYSSVSSGGLYVENPIPDTICAIGINMSRADDGAFAIHGFDILGLGGTYSGELFDGSVADLSVAIGTGDWLNLKSFSIYQDFGGFLGIDDIQVSAVPLPAGVWLFGSALAGLAWRRKTQTA